MSAVLVVEDEPLICEFVRDELEAEGFEVVVAGNADVAVQILERRSDIYLLFTDIDMPGSMDGLKFAALTRRRWPPIKVVIASGKHRPLESEMPPASVFLPKPYLPADVAKIIRSIN
jgi:two-component system, response regulator PdtaR